MPSILKRITNSLKRNKPKEKKQLILSVKDIDGDRCETVTPSTSNVTSITSIINPTLNVKTTSSVNKNTINNNSDSDRRNEPSKMGDHLSEISVVNCITGYTKDKCTNDTTKSISKSKIESENRNTSSNINDSDEVMSNIKTRLIADHEKLLKKNEKCKQRYESVKELNEVLKQEVLELERLNQKLLTDNAEVLHEAIKHRFLKLESEDLSKKTNKYKQKLEQKENIIVNFQKQFEKIRVKSNNAFKQKEEAQLEASHSCVKLKELANDCAELDIYKNENIQRKFYFNELQSVLGNVRVYLKIRPTNGESCLSFLADDKVLLTTTENKGKNLVCQFSHVFQPHNNNKDIFEELEPLLATVIDGYNCCFINYGQLGCGKTSTLFGDESNSGILRETLNFFLTSQEENTNWKYQITLSAVQINKGNAVDMFRKKPVNIVDDGENLILKCTEEKTLITQNQSLEVIKVIRTNRDSFKPIADVERTFSHSLIIIKVSGKCQISDEKTNGILMICQLAGFENEDNLKFTNRQYLKEEKHIHDDLIDIGKTLITLKMKNRKKPRTNNILTKLLYPCLTTNSKCCLLIHCFSDIEQQSTIAKSIQYGLAVMPKLKNKLKNMKYVVQWDFSDEKHCETINN